jgi:phosphoribosyl-AMP cyclohydrolase
VALDRSSLRGGDRQAREEGSEFAPRFDANGLIVCVVVDATSAAVLMVAYMNAEALDKTLATGMAHFWSRSRQRLWQKGETSGQVQTVVEIRVDCDQDALLLKVERGGDRNVCHTGRPSCFYRQLLRRDNDLNLVTDGTEPPS